jgi:hypothetical protein
MQIIYTVDSIKVLTREEIKRCLIGVSEDVMHYADNYLSVDNVRDMVRNSLYRQMKIKLQVSLSELEEKETPPWLRAGKEKPRKNYQTQARKSP